MRKKKTVTQTDASHHSKELGASIKTGKAGYGGAHL
jgi:hypothetical protein